MSEVTVTDTPDEGAFTIDVDGTRAGLTAYRDVPGAADAFSTTPRSATSSADRTRVEAGETGPRRVHRSRENDCAGVSLRQRMGAEAP